MIPYTIQFNLAMSQTIHFLLDEASQFCVKYGVLGSVTRCVLAEIFAIYSEHDLYTELSLVGVSFTKEDKCDFKEFA